MFLCASPHLQKIIDSLYIYSLLASTGRALQQSQVSYHQTPPRLQPNPAAFGNQYQQLLHPLPYTPAPTPAAVVPAPAQPSPPGVAPQPLPQEQQALPSTPQQVRALNLMICTI